MSKKSEIIDAEVRQSVGTRHSRRLRRDGRIPGVIGPDDKHPRVDIHIEEHNFLATRRRHTHLYEIKLGKELSMALVRELQWDTFGEQIVHIEFKRVQRDVKTESIVALDFIGHPKGGILNHLISNVTVLCVPTLIPDSIEVNCGHLELGGVVYARDLVLPEGVEYVGNKEQKIAVVVMAAKPEVVATAAEGAEGAAAATPAATPAAGAAAPVAGAAAAKPGAKPEKKG